MARKILIAMEMEMGCEMERRGNRVRRRKGRKEDGDREIKKCTIE